MLLKKDNPKNDIKITKKENDCNMFVKYCIDELNQYRYQLQNDVVVSNLTFEIIKNEVVGTKFGNDHGITREMSLSEWKKALPIRQYEEFIPYVNHVIEGYEKILTQSKPYSFVKTSGTSNKTKLVIQTELTRKLFRGPALYKQWGLYFEYMNEKDWDPSNIVDLSWVRTNTMECIGKVPTYSITQRPDAIGLQDWNPPWYNSLWFDLTSENDKYDFFRNLYRIILIQGVCKVKLLVSVNPSKIISLCELFNNEFDCIVQDIEDGTVVGKASPYTKPNPELAERLRKVRKAREGKMLITDLWPDLKLVVCWRSASAGLYDNWLKQLLPGVALLPFSTTGTEGIVTIPIDYHPTAGLLALDQGIYEFIPHTDENIIEDFNKQETLDYSQLETGKIYRLVMSQPNGLYRYDVRDLYEVLDWYGNVPRLEFVGRADVSSSFTGEKLTEVDIVNAVYSVFEELGIKSPGHFTMCPVWDNPPGYSLILEYSSETRHINKEVFSKMLDKNLCCVNIEYESKRQSQRLRQCSVEWVKDKAFDEYWNSLIKSGKTASAQIKHLWLQKNDGILQKMKNMGLIISQEGNR